MHGVGSVLHELLNLDWGMHRVQVLLGNESGTADQVVGISDDSRHCYHDVFVDFVELSTLSQRHEEFAMFLLLSNEDHTYIFWLSHLEVHLKS